MSTKAKEEVAEKKEYTLLKNLGSNKDGSPKKTKGSKVKLTDEQANHYKSLKLI